MPSTNPTSTAIYKIIICLKARCTVVLSPHPAAVRSVRRVAEVMTTAAVEAGAPEGAVNCMTTVTLEGTQELMRRREVALILATGGLGLVRAAYSAGKPAYGVGPGNAPAYIERTAELPKAVADIITGKTFDNGLLCSSENSVVVDEAVAGEVRREFERQGWLFSECRRSRPPRRRPRHRGPAAQSRAGRPDGGGDRGPDRDRCAVRHPRPHRSRSRGWDATIPCRSRSSVRCCRSTSPPTGGRPASGAWRSCATAAWGTPWPSTRRTKQVILEFGLRKPAFRIVVNTPTTLGSIGMTTGLDPSMTLGCGGHGGNITSDNITPRHLLNVKRLAWEVCPAGRSSGEQAAASVLSPAAPAAARPAAGRLDPQLLARRIDTFLAQRGVSTGSSPAGAAPMSPNRSATASPNRSATADATPEDPPPTPPVAPSASVEMNAAAETDRPVDFVCEDDVRQAVENGRRIAVNDRTIITPAARDLGEPHGIFLQA